MHVRRILLLSLAHFVVAMAAAAIAFGLDMDQLSSRSASSSFAAAIHDVLWLPHDSAMRAVPNAWVTRHRYIVPVAIVLNSVIWGALLYMGWSAVRRRRRAE